MYKYQTQSPGDATAYHCVQVIFTSRLGVKYGPSQPHRAQRGRTAYPQPCLRQWPSRRLHFRTTASYRLVDSPHRSQWPRQLIELPLEAYGQYSVMPGGIV
jgi:hypothetical protein